MAKTIVLFIISLFIAQAQACNVDSLRAEYVSCSSCPAAGELFQQPRDGRWCKWITVDIICGAYGDMIDTRNYPIRWDEYPSAGEEEAKCVQMKNDLLNSHKRVYIKIASMHKDVINRLDEELRGAVTAWYKWIKDHWPVTRAQAITAWGVAMEPLPVEANPLGVYYYNAAGFETLDEFIDYVLDHKDLLD